MSNNIKWGCIQPLTGGMYIGAEEAIGCPASWIISFEGLDEAKTNKEGKLGDVGNEYNLLKWLEKNNKLTNYYHFTKRQMFESFDDVSNIDLTQKIEHHDNSNDFNDVDIVVAVPVCSGLSAATIAKDETKDARNCNMLFITKYTLEVIKPKVYIFENAPRLISNAGDSVREILNKIAFESGYSVTYYKTDSQFHHNCQKRPRTFVVFTKWTGENQENPPEFKFEQVPYTVEQVFNQITSDATQQDLNIGMSKFNQCLLQYIIDNIGEDFRNTLRYVDLFAPVVQNNKYDEFINYINKYDGMSETEKEKAVAFVKHAQFKKSQGLNYYSMTACFYRDTTPSVMFKTIQTNIHHKENRVWNIRECLNLMGMPNDFELYGDAVTNAPKIGQNVPVKTAKWITSEAVRFVENWDNLNRETGENVSYYDNTKLSKIKK